MVYARDESAGRDSFVSYALVNLPTQPGTHHLSCHTWFAVESNRALGRSFFGETAREERGRRGVTLNQGNRRGRCRKRVYVSGRKERVFVRGTGRGCLC